MHLGWYGVYFGPLAHLAERLICIQEVSGSTPLWSTNLHGKSNGQTPVCKTDISEFNSRPVLHFCGSSSIGRAPSFQAGCCRFEPCLPHQLLNRWHDARDSLQQEAEVSFCRDAI